MMKLKIEDVMEWADKKMKSADKIAKTAYKENDDILYSGFELIADKLYLVKSLLEETQVILDDLKNYME